MKTGGRWEVGSPPRQKGTQLREKIVSSGNFQKPSYVKDGVPPDVMHGHPLREEDGPRARESHKEEHFYPGLLPSATASVRGRQERKPWAFQRPLREMSGSPEPANNGHKSPANRIMRFNI